VMDLRQFATDCAPQGTVLRQNKFKARGGGKDYCPARKRIIVQS
jgi:hypothetical protein